MKNSGFEDLYKRLAKLTAARLFRIYTWFPFHYISKTSNI